MYDQLVVDIRVQLHAEDHYQILISMSMIGKRLCCFGIGIGGIWISPEMAGLLILDKWLELNIIMHCEWYGGMKVY